MTIKDYMKNTVYSIAVCVLTLFILLILALPIILVAEYDKPSFLWLYIPIIIIWPLWVKVGDFWKYLIEELDFL
jgi:hypothetical protein